MTAAWLALRAHWRLVLFTYLVQVAVAGLGALAVWLVTLSLSGGSSLFEKAADGDLPALITVLKEQPALMIVPLVIALVALLSYAMISWFTTAGLIGVFRAAPTTASLPLFGHWGMRRFLSFARLAAWSLIPYGIVFALFAVRAGAGSSGYAEALTMSKMFAIFFGNAAPALVVLWIVWTIVDVARIKLVDAERPSAWRAIGRAVTAVARRPSLLAITLAGHLLSALVVVVSIKLIGIAGGFSVFLVRQLFLGLRHAVHVGVIAAEVDRVKLA